MNLLDLAADAHVRTRFADGADTIDDAIEAAERAGLSRIAVTDHVDARTEWIGTYERSIDRARRRTSVRIDCGVAVDILDADGTLDLPASLPGVEHVAVISRRFPLPGGSASAVDLRALIDGGRLHRGEAARHLVAAYIRALTVAADHAQPVLARPFAILGEAGLTEADLDNTLLEQLADGCRATGALVEVNERLVCPSPRVARWLGASGVRLVAASDSYRVRDVGRWEYVRFIASVLPGQAPIEDAAAG